MKRFLVMVMDVAMALLAASIIVATLKGTVLIVNALIDSWGR